MANERHYYEDGQELLFAVRPIVAGSAIGSVVAPILGTIGDGISARVRVDQPDGQATDDAADLLPPDDIPQTAGLYVWRGATWMESYRCSAPDDPPEWEPVECMEGTTRPATLADLERFGFSGIDQSVDRARKMVMDAAAAIAKKWARGERTGGAFDGLHDVLVNAVTALHTVTALHARRRDAR